ncbi:Ribosomal silencing factor RsfS [Candidatus Methylacidithermus pantelleriae]|uniref:Ribosomal silencing factor RsfS n=1 Tax=Candidatus Methylacidithermus pantelleriae TaxID=2744239 RepID=A0A8J2BNX2_9BACT|nr:Ribosomal silencing factor RsfS [Candidatus Methylacidithermus pantelleriae]
MTTLSLFELAKFCRDFVLEKKALAPVILDLRGISTVSDFFVICGAQSEPQLKAIAQGLEKTLKERYGKQPYAIEGFPKSHWVIVDYGGVMVHIFHEEKRRYYALEELWGDAPRL